VRASQKEATRQRVLASAKSLFAVHGYQGTTIRDIARDANVSVGSVFTAFASKGVILSEVMEARIEPLYAELDRVMPHLHGPTVDRLKTLFAIHIQFEMQIPRLFLSHIAAAYDWTLSPDAKPFGRNARLKGGVADCLAKGVADGDIRADVNLDDVVALIISAFAWTFRLAITQNADAKAMIAVMDRQISLIVEGLAPRP
jgi:AcrR family transcriptional regulator